MNSTTRATTMPMIHFSAVTNPGLIFGGGERGLGSWPDLPLPDFSSRPPPLSRPPLPSLPSPPLPPSLPDLSRPPARASSGFSRPFPSRPVPFSLPLPHRSPLAPAPLSLPVPSPSSRAHSEASRAGEVRPVHSRKPEEPALGRGRNAPTSSRPAVSSPPSSSHTPVTDAGIFTPRWRR